MAQRILGLDLGANEVKAVLVQSAFRGWSVARAAGTPGQGATATGPATGTPGLAAATTQQVTTPGQLVHWRED